MLFEVLVKGGIGSIMVAYIHPIDSILPLIYIYIYIHISGISPSRGVMELIAPFTRTNP